MEDPSIFFWIEPDGVVAIQAQEFDESVGMWLSPDGVEWQALRVPGGENARSRLGSTWFELAGTRLNAYPLGNGADPTPVDLGLVRPATDMSGVEDGWFGPISANTITSSMIGAAGERDHWIITFDDPPA